MFEKLKAKLKGKTTDTKESISTFKTMYDESKKQRGLAMYGQKYQDYLDMKEKHDEKVRKRKVSSSSKKVDVNGKSKQGKH
jgi:hypothetical protein